MALQAMPTLIMVSARPPLTCWQLQELATAPWLTAKMQTHPLIP